MVDCEGGVGGSDRPQPRVGRPGWGDSARTGSRRGNTVHNRIGTLEESGVVTGYAARIPPTEAGLDFYFMFLCTARISDRGAVAERALEQAEVVAVTELMTGQRNLHIKAVGSEHDDITRIAQQLDDLELEVNDEFLIRAEHEQALDFNAVG
jgi:DNA-binding Lrp family transcriptional regulator